MAHIEEELLQNLKSGVAVFKFIPDNIGEIVYCDSTNPKEAPDSKEKKRKKLFLSVLIPLALIAADWALFYTSPIMSSIVSVVLLIIMMVCINNTMDFDGTDYFVGTEGYALVDFKDTRNNIVAKDVHRFEDFSDLLTGETRQYRNRVYSGTDYFFQFWSQIKDGQKTVLASVESSYSQEKPGNYYTDQLYRFYKTVEDAWSQYKFTELKEGFGKTFSKVGFTVYVKDSFYPDYIVFDQSGMQIGETRYDGPSVKNIGFKNGSLVVEHINHTSKFFGLIQKGNKEEIPLNIIGNREIFLKFLEFFTQTM